MPRTRKTEAVKPKGPASPPGIRGEKRVKKTNLSVPLGPARRRGAAVGPTDPAAIDRRKQFSGTDEPAYPDRPRQTPLRRRGSGK